MELGLELGHIYTSQPVPTLMNLGNILFFTGRLAPLKSLFLDYALVTFVLMASAVVQVSAG